MAVLAAENAPQVAGETAGFEKTEDFPG